MTDVAPFSSPGKFYKGNLHTHSNLSDGALALDQVVEAYKSRGYAQHATVAVNYSDVQGGWAGDGNINTDPFFVTGYRLDGDPEHFSPCIDAGDNAVFDETAFQDNFDLDLDDSTTEATPDLDITCRIFNRTPECNVDMGAYEFGTTADVNDDGMVNIDDVFVVLQNWDPCPDPCPPYCLGDANQDCLVDIDDIFFILAPGQWTPHCGGGGPGGPPQGIWDCILRYASDPEALQTCIEAMTLTGGN